MAIRRGQQNGGDNGKNRGDKGKNGTEKVGMRHLTTFGGNKICPPWVAITHATLLFL